jgi:sortase A
MSARLGRWDQGRTLRLVPALLAGWGLVLIAQGLWIPVKAALAQVLLEHAFAAGQAAGKPAPPWPWADTAPIARLTVPRLGEAQIILSGGSGQALAFGPTELPTDLAGGPRGVTILAAHRDTHFRFMRDLRPGDEVEIERIAGDSQRYRITHFDTVRWDRFGYPFAPPRRVLALVTCFPFDAASRSPLRRIAWAEAVEPTA